MESCLWEDSGNPKSTLSQGVGLPALHAVPTLGEAMRLT